jgi:hypothetical protein
MSRIAPQMFGIKIDPTDLFIVWLDFIFDSGPGGD